MSSCKICGKENCKKHSTLIGKTINIKEFSGSSPPEIFVGKWNYPNVYTGILSPTEHGETQIMSSPEIWHQKKLSIKNILSLRNQLIYSRTQSNIKKLKTKFLETTKEIAMAEKPISAEYKLKEPIKKNLENDSHTPLISKAAQIENVSLQENPKINKKVDYIVNDSDIKSKTALLELENSNIPTSTMIKLLSAGLLGMKKNRKLVPTRWAITATDDTLSKEKIKKIKYYKEIEEFQLFESDYLGNFYKFLLIPDKFSFEVIEIAVKNFSFWTDYESFYGRKNYAESVTGAYYSNRLALTEYLEKIKRQSSCIVFREIRPQYDSPLGVGILRQTSREAFSKSPEKFSSLKEALQKIQEKIVIPIEKFTSHSTILKNYNKQTKLNQFI